MASERQIAANRRNAQKSTGPKTKAGKKRASANAYQHGLASPRIWREALAQDIDQLAREIAGSSENPAILEWAQTTAESDFELRRVRNVKAGLIDRMVGVGHSLSPKELESAEIRRFFKALRRVGIEMPVPRQPGPSTELPSEEPERTAEAVRRLLPELLTLER